MAQIRTPGEDTGTKFFAWQSTEGNPGFSVFWRQAASLEDPTAQVDADTDMDTNTDSYARRDSEQSIDQRIHRQERLLCSSVNDII
jgi:hypothetical protein